MTQHIVASYDSDLRALAGMVVDMGDQAMRLLDEALKALFEVNSSRAKAAIEADRRIDELQHQVEEKAITTIAKRQPLSSDLREVVAVLRLSNDLERVGDLAKNIAKRVVAMEALARPGSAPGLENLAERTCVQLNAVLEAYRIRDDAKAMQVWRSDGAIDALYNALFRELLTYMMEDPRSIGPCTHLLFCAKNLERIGDHATNIAETIHYLVTGRVLSEERPKEETVKLAAPVGRADK